MSQLLMGASLEDKARESVEHQRRLWAAFERTVGKVALDQEARILARFAGIRDGDSVLEVGCGTGRLLAGLSAITPRVTGVDVLAQAARSSRARGLDVVRGNGLSLPFHDSSFDIVILNDVIHNLPSELTESVLKELSRLSPTLLVGAVRNHLALYSDPGYVTLALRRGRRAESSAINADVAWFWRFETAVSRCGLAITGLQPAAHFQALYEGSSSLRRLYRVRPGAIGVFGWLLPRPYGWMQYDVLLRRS